MPITENVAKKMLEMRDREGLSIFVETGTHIGDGSAWALTKFDKVYTCEASYKFFTYCQSRFVNEPRIQLSNYSSEEFLEKVVKLLPNKKYLVFLDAHFSGGGTWKEKTECPILEELEVLLKYPNAFLVIDDVRLFINPPPPPHKVEDWPTLETISNLVKKYRPEAKISYDETALYIE